MSTLKVNAIEPYSGGTVNITGGTVASASYAETANTLTAGTKTITGDLNVNGNSILSNTAPGPNPLLTAADGNGPKLIVSNDDGVPIFGANMVVNGTTNLNGNVNLNGDERLNGRLIHNSGSANAALFLQNPNFFSSYHGTRLEWNPTSGLGGNGILTVSEKAEAGLQANCFPSDFSFDTVVTIKANANGAQFADWSLPSYGDNIWLQIPDQGTPSFKRGLDIQGNTTADGSVFISGSNNNPGGPHPLEVQDGAGDFPLLVLNAQTTAIAGHAIGIKNGVNITDGNIKIPGLGDYADDTAAAAGGVPVNGVYRTGSTLKIRVS